MVYQGASLAVVLNGTASGLSVGEIYRFRVQAVNEFGDSDFSENIRASLGSVPNKPYTPYKIEDKSSKTSIAVKWEENDDKVTSKLTGYKLFMDDGFNGPYTLILDGTNFPNTHEYTAQNLITGLPYRFRVVAVNINGDSIFGDNFQIYACLKPRNVLPPFKIGTTKTSISIEWTEPDSNGCPILGFEIYRDTGNSDSLSIIVDPLAISEKPSLR
jgi:hypothetical protein